MFMRKLGNLGSDRKKERLGSLGDVDKDIKGKAGCFDLSVMGNFSKPTQNFV